MTREEYEQCKVDQHSDDPYKAIQAKFILSMYPTFETKHKFNADSMDNFEGTLRGILKELERH